MALLFPNTDSKIQLLDSSLAAIAEALYFHRFLYRVLESMDLDPKLIGNKDILTDMRQMKKERGGLSMSVTCNSQNYCFGIERHVVDVVYCICTDLEQLEV